MNLRTAAAVGAAFGILGVGSAFATFARVESMGKNTTYIMDDVSILTTRPMPTFIPTT